MRILVLACAVLACCAAGAKAADLPISNSALGSMGLAKMQPLTDSEGLAVRGKGLIINVNPFRNSPFPQSNSLPSPGSVLLPQIAEQFKPHFAAIVGQLGGTFQNFPGSFH